jgi:hypothetical protein
MATQMKSVANRFINADAGFSQPVEHERTQFPRPFKTRHAEQYKRDIRQKAAPINWLRLGSFFGFDTARWTPAVRRDIFDPVWQHSL